MKKILVIGTTIALSIFLYACSETETFENYELEYKSEVVNLSELINNKNKAITKKKLNNSDIILQSTFKTNFVFPQNLNEKKLEEYLISNKDFINGEFSLLINGSTNITLKIVGGEIIRKNKKAKKRDISLKQLAKSMNVNPEYPLMDECSYDGIQDCVQYAVYEEWTTVEAIICAATGGLNCIAVEATACIETNCF